MYGIFTYICHKNYPNVGKYTSATGPLGYEKHVNWLSHVTLALRREVLNIELIKQQHSLKGFVYNHGCWVERYMGVSKNYGTPKSSILIGFSIIFTIHFGGTPPLFLETPIYRHSLPVKQEDSWVDRLSG